MGYNWQNVMEKRNIVNVENYMDRMTFIAYSSGGTPRVITVYRSNYSSDYDYQRACDSAREDAERWAE